MPKSAWCQISGTNGRRHLIVWKYNSSGCLTTLKNKCAMESLTYSKLCSVVSTFKSETFFKTFCRRFVLTIYQSIFIVFFIARKVPLLIFSGGSNGHVSKWERLQSNNFMYR